MQAPQEVREDFRNHLFMCMRHLGLGEPSPLQYAIAETIQNGDRDFQLQAGRGAGKSTVVAMYASWLLLNDPNCTILVLSATQDKAIKFISQVRRILDLVPYMANLIPGPQTKDSAFGFNVLNRTREGQDLSVTAKGITGQITGAHADYVLCDDVEIEKNSDTPQARNKLIERCAELEQIRNPVPHGRIVLLGTYQSTDSIYLRLPYKIIKFPAVFPDPEIESQVAFVAPYILELDGVPGTSVDPQRFSQAVLDERMAKIGPRQFALHYLLDPTLSDSSRYPLRLDDLIVMDVSPDLFPEKVVWGKVSPLNIPTHGINGDLLYKPQWVSEKFVPYLETILFVDPSGRGADETAICVASFVNGYIVVHALEGLDGGYSDVTLLQIAKLAYRYKANRILVESNYGDGMFTNLLRPIVAKVCGRMAVDEFRVSGSKEKRIIDTLEPVMSQHRLIMSTSAITAKATQTQITRMQDRKGALKHDDRIDVLASAVQNWSDAMIINPDTQIERNTKKAHAEVVKQWLSNDRIMGLLPNHVSGAILNRDNPNNSTQRRSIIDHFRS